MTRPKITICMGSSCFSRGNQKNLDTLQAFLEARHLKDEVDVELKGALCQNRCLDGPVLIVNDAVYTKVDRGVVLDLLRGLFGPE